MSARGETGEAVAVDGIRLWVERSGGGAPLVMIPGLGAGNWLWWGSTDGLAGFGLVMPELRGSARSDKPDEVYTIERFTRDVLAVMDHYGIARAHVLGASMGGFVAQALASAAPERVSRLVLVATSLGGARQVGPPGEVLARTIRPHGRTRRDRLNDSYELGFTPAYRASHGATLDAITEWRLTHPQPEWAYYRQLLAGWAYDGVAAASGIHTPTLICAGAADPVVPVENAYALRDRIPGARVLVFEGRHLFFLEHPRKFAHAVAAFLGDGATPG